jgi:predicted RND superfamily exporter protein
MMTFFAFIGIIACAIMVLIAIAVLVMAYIDRYQTREYRIKQIESNWFRVEKELSALANRLNKLETPPPSAEGVATP